MWSRLDSTYVSMNISTPAAKAPRIPMFFLCLVANVPPNSVEKQVMIAKNIALGFIGILVL